MLSMVVPAYKQEKTIRHDLENLGHAIQSLHMPYEIIVVIDGIVDNTHKQVKKVRDAHLKMFIFKKNYGKGHAVRYGMLKAKGDIIGFIDAGMDIDPEGITMLLQHMQWYDADIIVGSKLHPVSQVYYPFERKILSWGYRTFSRLLFGFKVRDTQVGLKLFKRKVVEDVFPRLIVKQFAFDIEILAIAYFLGYHRIYEAPIKLSFGKSTITSSNFWRVTYHMLLDTLAVFYRLHILHYYEK